MDFTPNTKPLTSEKLGQFDTLQLYREIPDVRINLDEFEDWAVERLKGKKKIDYFIFVNKNQNTNSHYFYCIIFSLTNTRAIKCERNHKFL